MRSKYFRKLKQNEIVEQSIDQGVERTISVRFINSHSEACYSYKEGLVDVSLGDIVLVHTRYGPALGQVEAIEEGYSSIAGQAVIDVMSDASPYLQKLKDEKRSKHIRSEIKARMKVLDEAANLSLYADLDPGIATLAEEALQLEQAQSTYEEMTQGRFTHDV